MKKIHIISHTHWDREWYRPFEYFRSKLVFVMDSLISILEKDSRYAHFLLDGQTSPLEDYLEVKPENTEKLAHFIKTDRLIVGPWYIQPDEFAPDGESLIRNLQMGIRTAEKFGKSMMVGYLPDTFGHSGQLPQILQGFGIDCAVVMRGVPAHIIQSSEFTWEGINGEQVLAVFLPHGYSNALFMPEEFGKFSLRLSVAIRQLKKWVSTDNYLIMNGVDHQFPQAFMGEFIERLNAAHKNELYLHSTLQDYITDVRKSRSEFVHYQGELTSPVSQRVHTSIASTRIYQKQANRQVEALLEHYTEPAATTAWLFGADYPQGLIRQAWKYLIQNQTHDGIGGCCTDEVHREMDQRFVKSKTICETLIKGTSRAIAKRISPDQCILTVFNSAMLTGKQVVHATVYVKNESFSLEDHNGKKIAYQIEHSEEVDISQLNIWSLYLASKQIMKKMAICFTVDFDFNIGYKVFRIDEKSRPQKAQSAFTIYGNTIENKFFILKICKNGSLDLYDKELDTQFHNLHLFEDCGDAGDSYNYSPVRQDTVISSQDSPASFEIEQNGAQQVTAKIALTLDVPESLMPDDSARSSEKIALPITSRVTLYADIKRIDFKTEIENTARDHRLRILFPTGIHTQHSLAETQFGTVERSSGIEDVDWEKEGWKEKPLPIYSHQKFVALNDGEKGFAVLNRGLSEYEVYDHSSIAITLLRSFGFMGKENLLIRPGRYSGMPTPTPDAQCLGNHIYEYAILPHKGSIEESHVPGSTVVFHAPALAVQNEIYPKRALSKESIISEFGSIETITSHIQDQLNELPNELNILTLDPPELIISAFKKAEDEEAFIVRLYNPGKVPIKDAVLQFGIDIKEGYLTNFNEKETRPLEKGKKNTFQLPELRAYTAVTMKFFPE
ncbi:MAG: hypothetical protein GYA52_04460 [Chloroflexi bacterium]|nr:hypothetical protein [Chloroflexota bacterium]